MTKTYGDMIGLRQPLYVCKAEKTYLNDKVVILGFMCLTNCCKQTTKDMNFKFASFKR